jgi:hypothetical protein
MRAVGRLRERGGRAIDIWNGDDTGWCVMPRRPGPHRRPEGRPKDGTLLPFDTATPVDKTVLVPGGNDADRKV